MKCKYCDNELTKDDVYCYKCGKRINDINECPNCHTKLVENVQFCPECGTKLINIEVTNDSKLFNTINNLNDYDTVQLENDEFYSEKKSKKPLIIVLVSVLVIGIVVTTVIFLLNRNDTSKTNNESITTTNNNSNNNTQNQTSQNQTQKIDNNSSNSSTNNTIQGSITAPKKEETTVKANDSGIYIVVYDGIRLRKCGDESCDIVQYDSLPNNIRSICREGKNGVSYLDKNDIINVLDTTTSNNSTWVKLADNIWACSVYKGETWIKKQ